MGMKKTHKIFPFKEFVKEDTEDRKAGRRAALDSLLREAHRQEFLSGSGLQPVSGRAFSASGQHKEHP